jgi:transposase
VGRKKILDDRDIRILLRIVNSGWNGRELSWKKLVEEAGLNCSGATAKRALNQAGYKRCKACLKSFLSPTNIKKRLNYARKYRNHSLNFWRKHIYADEMSVNTADRGTKWVTRKEGERYHKDCLQMKFWSGRQSFMVWGAIGYNWKSKLIFLKGTGKRGICSRDYLEQVLEPYIGPIFLDKETELYNPKENSFKGIKVGGRFVEDNAGVHGTIKALVAAKKRLKIELHDHPASSPDMNPIEHIWRMIKARIKKRRVFPRSLPELKQAVQEEWDKITLKERNKLIDSMPDRIEELYQKKGMNTQY